MYVAPGDITQKWTKRKGFLGWRSETIEVHAWQEEVKPPYMPGTSTAKVAITVDGKLAHEADVPWALPNGNVTLPMQVFLLSKMPTYKHPEWQQIMEHFARHCEGFAEPTQVWWNSESPFD